MRAAYSEIISFIRQTYNTKEAKIPLHSPVFGGNELKYVTNCIESTFVSSVGSYVDLFEQKIEEFTGATKAVACVNGTNALFLALKLSGVQAGEEVITQPLTFIATVNAIRYCGADPLFLDVDSDTLGLSPGSLEEFLADQCKIDDDTGRLVNLNTGKVISACLPVHTFGHPARIDKIVEICNRYHLPVVEDAAESIGSLYKGRHTGTFGQIGVFSFNGNKTITTGGGGMLIFQDFGLAEKAKHLTTQARIQHAWEFVHDEVGYNYRLPNINAALGVAQMEQLDSFIQRKRDLSRRYMDFFRNTGVIFFTEPENARSNYWLNCIFLPDKEQRDSFLAFSNNQGVMTRPCWKLINQLPMFKNCYSGNLDNSSDIADRLVNIPSSVVL